MQISIESNIEYNLEDIFNLLENNDEKKYGFMTEDISCEDHDCSSTSLIVFNNFELLMDHLKKNVCNSDYEDIIFADDYSEYLGDNNIFVQIVYSQSSVCYYKIIGLNKKEFKILKKSVKESVKESKN